MLGETTLGETTLGKTMLGKTTLGKTTLGKTMLGKTMLGEPTSYQVKPLQRWQPQCSKANNCLHQSEKYKN
jgi:hypothetical protein